MDDPSVHSSHKTIKNDIVSPRIGSVCRRLCDFSTLEAMQATMQQRAAAFRELLGMDALPQTGKQAREASQRLGAVVAASMSPPPLLSRLLAEHLASLPPLKPRFADVSTGLRLRYLEWGSGGDVVLLLHDLGEAADIWAPLGPRLADRGYRVFALDLRGHGESGRSLDGRYSADMLAEDVKAFILAKDLYVAPVAIVGCGMGAAAALALAQANPFLAGAVIAAEFALPVSELQPLLDRQAEAGSAEGGNSASNGSSGASGIAGSSSSKQLLPWWGFRAGQASSFSSAEHCAACLAHPLVNLTPRLVVPLAKMARQAIAAVAGAQGSADGDLGAGASPAGTAGESMSEVEVLSTQQLLEQAGRPLQGAIASACSLLRLPSGMERSRGGYGTGGGGLGGGCWDDDWQGESFRLEARMDPTFLFSFEPAALLAGLPSLRGHLLLLHGSGGGSWVEPAEAAAMAEAAARGGAASAAVEVVPGAGHWLAADHPDRLLQHITAFLEGPAVRCFDRQYLMAAVAGTNGSAKAAGSTDAAAAAGRRPELLGLKPLPQYASLEEAQKALGPRTIPTPAAIDAELRKLRVEEGRAADDASSDEEEGSTRRHRTALAKEPADYFGFVG